MSEPTVPQAGRPPRVLILPAAAILIAGLTAWRLANPPQGVDPDQLPAMRRPAPSFQLYEQGSTEKKSRIVNLEAFLHRHRIVIAFFDGQKGPEADPVLQNLRDFYPALKAEGIIVLGIPTALPQENRNNSSQPFPFSLLSDVTATATQSVHRTWGRFVEPSSLDKPTGTKPGVFVIDRAGLVAWEGEFPQPDPSPETIVARLLKE